MKKQYALAWLALVTTYCAVAQYTGSPHLLQNEIYAPDAVYVKFADDAGISVQNNELVQAGKPLRIPFVLQGAGTWRSVHALPAATLEQFRKNAAQNLHREMPDPNSEFYFLLHSPGDLHAVKEQLAAWKLVQRALYIPVLRNAAAPDYLPFQTYLYPNGSGINAAAVWADYGNRGTGIKVCDIEYAYRPSHLDLPPVTLLGPVPEDPFGGTGIDHGTAVLGELASLDNGVGTTGIAADCELYFAAAYSGGIYDLASAITQALTTLGPGDVILLEQQLAGPNVTGMGQEGLVPVEWYQPYYDAIVLATGQGVTVVEAAGNGSENLDDSIYITGNGGHYPFMADGINSGAIIVGAGTVDITWAGSGVARSRLWFSNYGSRLDLQANGEAIYTTGYGWLFGVEGPDNYYTDDFGGTSGASPIVTGAAVLLQSVYFDSTGTYLSPERIRHFLTITGQPQQSGTYPVGQHIGPLPDVYQAIQTALAVSGVEKQEANMHASVYPNPVSNGSFTISWTGNNGKGAYVNIYDARGQAVPFRWVQNNSSINVQLNSGACGMYIIQVNTGTGSFTGKITVN